MKKLLIALGALLLASGAWAEDNAASSEPTGAKTPEVRKEEKTTEAESLKLFDELVAGMKKITPEDAEVRGDRNCRFIYMDLRMPVDSTAPFDISEAKNGVVMYLKDSAELFETLKATLLVNFVTTDRRIRTVVVTPQELRNAAPKEE